MERIAELARCRVDPALFMALLLVSVFSIFDYYLTQLILGLGGVEANPIFRDLLSTQPRLCYWLKFGLTSGGIMVLAALSQFRMARTAVYAMLSVYVALIFYEIALIYLLVIP